MKTITPIELQMLIDQCDVELIDVRSKKDFKTVHALGARSIPLSGLEPHSILAHRKLDRRAPLYIMSRERALASLAACSLAGAGLAEPVVVEGGIEASSCGSIATAIADTAYTITSARRFSTTPQSSPAATIDGPMTFRMSTRKSVTTALPGLTMKA